MSEDVETSTTNSLALIYLQSLIWHKTHPPNQPAILGETQYCTSAKLSCLAQHPFDFSQYPISRVMFEDVEDIKRNTIAPLNIQRKETFQSRLDKSAFNGTDTILKKINVSFIAHQGFWQIQLS